MGTNVDWFARSLAILAILISLMLVYLRVWQARKQRPILKVEQSEIEIQEQFDKQSKKHNSDVFRNYSKYRLPDLLVPVAAHLIIRNLGLTPAAITYMHISLESTRVHLIDAFKLLILVKLGKRGRNLGDAWEYISDENFLYLKPDQSPLKLPLTIGNGQAIECQGVFHLGLPITDEVFQSYKLYKSELKEPLDFFDFVVWARGFSAEKSRFRLLILSGSEVLYDGFFNRNKYFPAYWFRR